MPEHTWHTTDVDREKARGAVEGQAKAHSLDSTIQGEQEEAYKAFLTHMVEVIAALEAQCRFLRNVIHERDGFEVSEDGEV
jgi:hypothetical protein